MKKFNEKTWVLMHPVVVAVYIAITLVFMLAISAHGQNVVQNGKTFIEQVDSTKTRQSATKTDYVYIDQNGDTYPIFLSSKGNAFIIKTSKRTGKPYRKYIKTITNALKK